MRPLKLADVVGKPSEEKEERWVECPTCGGRLDLVEDCETCDGYGDVREEDEEE